MIQEELKHYHLSLVMSGKYVFGVVKLTSVQLRREPNSVWVFPKLISVDHKHKMAENTH